jgi:RNA polymerase sigma-70 factor, ECF subfamily
MRSILDGDHTAVAELYDRYGDAAMAVAVKIVRDTVEAEDLVHDAFVVIVQRADQFRVERGSVAAWLITTVRNLSLDRARRRARRAQIAKQELSFEPVAPPANPEVIAEVSRDRDRVRTALGKLSDAQRATLEIAFFEGLSYPEIAEREKVPLGTVKSRAARALAALREALDEP